LISAADKPIKNLVNLVGQMKILYLFLSAIIPHDFVLLVLMKHCSGRARFQFLIKKIYFFVLIFDAQKWLAGFFANSY